jgi:hypothetical protein
VGVFFKSFIQNSSSFVFFVVFFQGVGSGILFFERSVHVQVWRLVLRPPMSSKTTFKCLHCNEKHPCDPRNRGRQRYCSKPDCRQVSKAASQRQWVSRAENQNYFRGVENCERVRQWRLANPGYWRNKRSACQSALQDPLIPQNAENQAFASSVVSVALQDLCISQPALLVGLISVVTGHALQEDIAASARSFVNRGRDILRMVPSSPEFQNHENQDHPVSRTLAARASPI